MITRARVGSVVSSTLMIAAGTYALREWGWKIWLGVLAGLIAMRIGAWVEGFEQGREQGRSERRW